MLEVRQRARRVAEAHVEKRPEALLQIEPRVAAARRKAALEQGREAIPPLLRRIERIERPDGLLVRRVDLENALVIRNRPRPVAGDLLGDERDLREELRAAERVDGRGDHALIEARELRPLLVGRENLLQANECVLVARRDREHPLEVRPRTVDIVELLVVEGGETLREIELHRLG